MNPHNRNSQPERRFSLRLLRPKWLISALIAAVAASALLVGATLSSSPREREEDIHIVTRGDLRITVIEAGSLQAFRSLEIKSEVDGQTRIISLVPEGTYITEEDVKNRRVLVELDSSEIQEKATQQEITFLSAKASYTQAKEAYDIQVNQNESNINKAELDLKFAEMDLKKYLGSALAEEVMKNKPNFLELGQHPALGGEALQKRRKLQSDIDLAKEELKRAADKVEWTEKLYARGFVSQNELEADRLAFKRQEVQVEQAQTALEQFLRYEFPKEAEKLLSDRREKERALERVRAQARSELAKAEAELRSRESTFNLQEDRLKKLKEQIEKCTIRAARPGLVVYGPESWGWGSREVIEEGATVRQRQVILRLPDPSIMVARVKVHESAVEKVKVGQPAKVVVDAFPDKPLSGRVTKVGVLPAPLNRWLNPDLKVYETDITIDGYHSFLKPGMSAQVEILVDVLKNVLTVPIQAISVRDDIRVCYVVTNEGVRIQPVETGSFSDKFIEVTKGLSPGDRVLLRKPSHISSKSLAEFAKHVAAIKQEKNHLLSIASDTEPTTPVPSVETNTDATTGPVNSSRTEGEPIGRMRERLEKMSPEERRSFMERRELRRMQGGGRPPRGGPP